MVAIDLNKTPTAATDNPHETAIFNPTTVDAPVIIFDHYIRSRGRLEPFVMLSRALEIKTYLCLIVVVATTLVNF